MDPKIVRAPEINIRTIVPGDPGATRPVQPMPIVQPTQPAPATPTPSAPVPSTPPPTTPPVGPNGEQ